MIDHILVLLKDDLLSHGFLKQFLESTETDPAYSPVQLRNVIAELLETGVVEIGTARLANPSDVEFVAWNGTVEERVERGIRAVANSIESDKEFAYWLCLRRNVDRFEV